MERAITKIIDFLNRLLNATLEGMCLLSGVITIMVLLTLFRVAGLLVKVVLLKLKAGESKLES